MRFKSTAIMAVTLTALLFASVSCGQGESKATPVPTSVAQPSQTPTSKIAWGEKTIRVECPSTVPADTAAECGYLVVPENRAKSDGKSIKLAFALVHSYSATPLADPVVYLQGGPGGSILQSMLGSLPPHFDSILETRDAIFFDQRGTGYSEPALDCPEVFSTTVTLLQKGGTPQERVDAMGQSLRTCNARLKAEGIDLTGYTTAENAADISELAKALGYEKWNLYGSSYGTRLALTAMRDSPSGIRSVILDGVVPLQVDLLGSMFDNRANALDLLFDACKADKACVNAYPDLKANFYATAQRLATQPVSVTITLPTGEPINATMTSSDFVDLMLNALQATELAPLLPELISESYQGKFGNVERIASILLLMDTTVARGMQYTVQCSEEAAFSSDAALEAGLAKHPELTAVAPEIVLGDKVLASLCKGWGGKSVGSIENQPVSSDIPALVLSGKFDPVTPPSYGKLAASTLPNSFTIEFPNASHGQASADQCSTSIVQAFLDDPRGGADTKCMAGSKLAFELPAKLEEIKMRAIEEKDLGYTGVAPDGWTRISVGAYARAANAMDPTSLSLLPSTSTADTIVGSLKALVEKRGFKTAPVVTEKRDAHGLTWTVYSFGASSSEAYDAAVTEKGGITYLILLGTLPDQRDALYKTVLLPAVDAFTPTAN